MDSDWLSMSSSPGVQLFLWFWMMSWRNKGAVIRTQKVCRHTGFKQNPAVGTSGPLSQNRLNQPAENN